MSKDTEQALARLEEAKKRGDFDAVIEEAAILAMARYVDSLFELGRRFESRHVGPHDNERAVRMYRLAAEHGHANAQFNLASKYMMGEGVEQDLVVAYAWFILAGGEESLSDLAAGQARQLKSLLTPEEIAEAERLAVQWRANIANTREAKHLPVS